MHRAFGWLAAGTAVVGLFSAVALRALQAPGASGRTFRGGTDLLLVDVSVLDKSRHPVRDLTAADFTVLIDGKTRPVVAFNVVDVPPPVARPAGEASWTRDVAPDVVTNEKKPGRVFVILLDDYSMYAGLVDAAGIIQARKAAHAVVDAMGPDDRAAVVMSFYGHTAQDFTSDRQLLRKAIDEAPLFPGSGNEDHDRPGEGEIINMGGCDCGACNLVMLDQLAQAMRALPEQRKVLFHISAGSVVTPSEASNGGRKEYCEMVRRETANNAIRHAQLANVTIESFDPRLLRLTKRNFARPSGADAIAEAKAALQDPALHRTEFLRTVAEQTGGRAIVNNNDIDLQVPSVVAESSAYYLLGVERPPTSDGKQHSVQVRVNRKDVEVRTRKGYTDETAQERRAAAEAAAKGDLSTVISSPLAVSGVPLGITAAPFAAADGKPAVVLTLRIDTPKSAPIPRTESVEIVSSLYFPETAGTAGSLQQRATMNFTKPDPRFDSYEIHSQLPAKPGRYALRVGVKMQDGSTSSVYTTLTVPDFDDALALSGLVLRASPAPVGAGANTIEDLLPVTPTSQRVFRKTDDVSAFMRIYEKQNPFVPVNVSTTLTDAKNAILATFNQTLEGVSIGTRRAVTYDVALPVAELPPGEYLLNVSVTAGTRNAGRQLRFTVEDR